MNVRRRKISPCGIDGCQEPGTDRTMCWSHYSRAINRIRRANKHSGEMHDLDVRRYARENYSDENSMKVADRGATRDLPTCAVCGKESFKNSLCQAHWKFIHRGGENFAKGYKLQ